MVPDKVFATNAKGQTALFVALKNGRIGAARALLEHVERMPEASRKNIAAADSSAARPLYMAVLLQEEEIVRRILALNYEMWNERRFALYKARQLKNPAICRAIAEHHRAMPLDITPSMTMQARTAVLSEHLQLTCNQGSAFSQNWKQKILKMKQN